MNRSVPKGSYSAPALQKAFEIMELLAEQPGGLLLGDIAARLDRSIGELFRIMIVMERHGYLQKSAITDKYSIAYKLLDLAFRGTPSQNLSAAAIPRMETLSEKIGQSCHLVVQYGSQGIVIARQENPGQRSFQLKLGAIVDIFNSCSGQVLLAFSPPARVERIFAHAEPVITSADKAQYLERIEAVRSRGYDLRQSPITLGVTDISYPIFGFDGDVLAALTVPFMKLIDGSQKIGIDEAQILLAEATQKISDALGFNILQ